MGLKKTAAEQRCDEIVAFISDYVLRNGYSPAFREVGEAVGLHSPSSISKYLHRLAEEGRVFFDESRPRTISTVDRRDDIETISRRICLEMADGGKLYMDCHLQKPKAAPVSVCFDGILDAKSMRGKIGQVVGCTASCD